MPKTEKRVYTYDQLDAILRRRGFSNEKPALGLARLRSTVHASTTYTGVGLSLRHVGTYGFEFARVYKVAGGDTLYSVFGLAKDKHRKERTRGAYRRAVTHFTPYDVVGHTPLTHVGWFRVRDGASRFVTDVETFTNGEPRNCWLGFHDLTRPSYDQWLSPLREHHPRLCNRARSFYVRLRRALKDGLPCTVQLLTHGERPRGARYGGLPNGPSLHVCVPPCARGQTEKLVLAVANHDLESRRHFGVDGDFGHSHAQVWGVSVLGNGDKCGELRWKSTRDAIVGVKEWVMNSVYIPGF